MSMRDDHGTYHMSSWRPWKWKYHKIRSLVEDAKLLAQNPESGQRNAVQKTNIIPVTVTQDSEIGKRKSPPHTPPKRSKNLRSQSLRSQLAKNKNSLGTETLGSRFSTVSLASLGTNLSSSSETSRHSQINLNNLFDSLNDKTTDNSDSESPPISESERRQSRESMFAIAKSTRQSLDIRRSIDSTEDNDKIENKVVIELWGGDEKDVPFDMITNHSSGLQNKIKSYLSDWMALQNTIEQLTDTTEQEKQLESLLFNKYLIGMKKGYELIGLKEELLNKAIIDKCTQLKLNNPKQLANKVFKLAEQATSTVTQLAVIQRIIKTIKKKIKNKNHHLHSPIRRGLNTADE